MCGGGNHTYSIHNVNGATSYVWTVPAGFTLVQYNGTSTIISVSATVTTAQIKVAAANNCGLSADRSLTIYAVAPNPSSAINGPTSVAAGQSGVKYSLPNSANLVYTWTVPNGAIIQSGQGTHIIKVKFGTQSGAVKVFVSNSCGSSPVGQKFVTVTSSFVNNTTTQDDVKVVVDMNAYPNPTTGYAQVIFNEQKAATYELVITDLAGNRILQHTGTTSIGENSVKIDLTPYDNFMYIIKLITDNDVKTSNCIKKNNY